MVSASVLILIATVVVLHEVVPAVLVAIAVLALGPVVLVVAGLEAGLLAALRVASRWLYSAAVSAGMPEPEGVVAHTQAARALAWAARLRALVSNGSEIVYGDVVVDS